MARTATATVPALPTNGHATPAKREPPDYSVLEKLVVNGDVAALTPDQRIQWYYLRCEAAGLDPRTQPFQYVEMKKGGLKLYATKTASDQLIANRKLDVKILSREYNRDLYTYEVVARVKTQDGQEIDDAGVVSLDGLAREDLANAMLRCVTKAKRRTVLSACGLGMMDETEVETIADACVVRSELAAPAPPAPPRPAPSPPPIPRPRPAPPQPGPEPEPSRSEARAWIQDRIDEANSNWAMTCGAASKDYTPLVKNVHHLVNGIVSDWLAEDKINPSVVETAGKRDKAKVGEFVRELWREDRDGLMEDVEAYLEGKQREAARAAGINMDSAPPEEAVE